MDSLDTATRLEIEALDAMARALRAANDPSRRWKLVTYLVGQETEANQVAISPEDFARGFRQATGGTPPGVSYDQFRASLGPGELALLYEVNYQDRREQRDVPIITEGDVQNTWRNVGWVPDEVTTYARSRHAAIITLRQMPRVGWTSKVEKRILDALRRDEFLLEIAYQHRVVTGECMTVGAIKGRVYNVLSSWSDTDLRMRGFNRQQIAFLRS